MGTGLEFDVSRMESALKFDMPQIEMDWKVDLSRLESALKFDIPQIDLKVDLAPLESALKFDLPAIETNWNVDFSRLESALKFDMPQIRADWKTDLSRFESALKFESPQIETNLACDPPRSNAPDVKASHIDIEVSDFDEAVQASWVSLDSLNSYIGGIKQQLIAYQTNLVDLGYRIGRLVYRIDGEGYWQGEYLRLVEQAQAAGVSTGRLRQAQRAAMTNPSLACRLLASELHNIILGKVVKLRRRLRLAKALKVSLLRLVAKVYRFHNAISLQREYYLAHGSHPSSSYTNRRPSRFGQAIRGCVPALLVA